MNWDTVKGDWKTFRGKVKERFGRISDDELEKIAGRREQLAGAIQKSYGVAKDEAERQLRDFETQCESCSTSSGRQPQQGRASMPGHKNR